MLKCSTMFSWLICFSHHVRHGGTTFSWDAQASATADTWTFLGSAPWSGRDRAAAAVLGGRVFMAGGDLATSRSGGVFTWGFPYMGYPHSWRVFGMENPTSIDFHGMMTGGIPYTPISGNRHMPTIGLSSPDGPCRT